MFGSLSSASWGSTPCLASCSSSWCCARSPAAPNRPLRLLTSKEPSMETIWFCLVAAMIAIYVLLDGFDLGAGAVSLLVARTDAERRQVLATIGPVWDGNEV